ncbi:MAG: insulinase family protein [Planctomycetes bacterium]|nr:insulinase family protein [Planctomycetota bacterium]
MPTLPKTLMGLAAVSGISLTTLSGTEIQRAFLKNGLEVLLIVKEGVPLVTIEIAVRAGAFIETPELDGLTHLHEHMFFKANRAIPDQTAYLRRLDELGMSWNGSTSHEVVRYFFTLPSELIRDGLVFMRDAIQTPIFLQEELEKERQVVIGEYDRNEANPSFHLRQALDQALFEKYFSRKNVIGSRDVIGAATREQLEFIQDQFYVPNNAALILAGEFDPKPALSLVEELFSAWERRPDPFANNPVPEHPPLAENKYLVVTRPVQSASLRVGWHGPSVTADSKPTVAADVLSIILRQPSSAFHKALVDSGLATFASLSYFTLKYTGPLTLSLETRPEKALQALRAAREQLEALSMPGALSQEELDRAKREVVHDEIFARQKTRDFAIQLGFWWSVGGTDYYLSYPKRVQEITLEDLQEFARRFLSRPHVVAALAAEEAVARHGLQAEALRAAFDGAGGEAGRDLIEASLPNGARLIIRPLPSAEVAAFQAYFLGTPLRVQEPLAGIEQLLLETLADCLERKHLDELNRLGARFGSAAAADYASMSFECLRASFPRALELLVHALSGLEYGAEDVERNRSRMIDAYRKAMDTPDHKVGFLVNSTFYPPGHPYRAYPGGVEESLRRITIEDLARHRRELLQGKRLLLVAAGSLPPEEVRRLAGKAFEKVPAGEPLDLELGEIGGEAPNRLTIEAARIPTSYVLGKFRAPSPREADFDALQLALRVLHRRLFLEVRTKRALTYAVVSGMAPRLKSMGFLSVSSTRPEEALRVIYQTVDGLIGQPLPPDELQAAALTFATADYLRQETPGDQAARLGVEQILGGDCRRAFNLVERLKKIAPADVQRVLKTYVRGLHFAVLGPGTEVDQALFTAR